MSRQIIAVPEWPRPKGYSNGIIASGRTLYIAGQIGWDASGKVESGFVAQFDRALANVLSVVAAAGAGPEALVRLTIYVTDLDAYRHSLAEIGQIYRARMGKVYPVMALLGVAGLVEREAMVEIEAIAALDA